jgi:hypothetical protein
MPQRGTLQALSHLDHCRYPCGTFGMNPAGEMVHVAAVGDQQGFAHRLTPKTGS